MIELQFRCYGCKHERTERIMPQLLKVYDLEPTATSMQIFNRLRNYVGNIHSCDEELQQYSRYALIRVDDYSPLKEKTNGPE